MKPTTKQDLQLSGPQALAAQGDKHSAVDLLLERAHALAEALSNRLGHLPFGEENRAAVNDMGSLAYMLVDQIEEAQVLLPHLACTHLHKADVEAVAATWGVTAAPELAALWKLAQTPGALRLVCKTLALAARDADGAGVAVSKSHLESARMRLGGQNGA